MCIARSVARLFQEPYHTRCLRTRSGPCRLRYIASRVSACRKRYQSARAFCIMVLYSLALVHLPLAALPEGAAQLALEDLARATDRQRLLADLDAARALVVCDQLLTVGDDRFLRRQLALLRHH